MSSLYAPSPHTLHNTLEACIPAKTALGIFMCWLNQCYFAPCLTDTLAQHTSCCVGLWDGLLEPDPQWCSAAGDTSWISSGCTNSRPFLWASCTSSGCTAMLSSFWRFGRARSTVSRYLERTMQLHRLHQALHAVRGSYHLKKITYKPNGEVVYCKQTQRKWFIQHI